MKNKLNSILLVDDNSDCNFFHKRLFQKMDVAEKIEIVFDGKEAIDYLTSKKDGKYPQPSIIFLDINMPVMNGWEFLDEYEKLTLNQKAKVILVMLTTSLNPDDIHRAEKNPSVSEFKNKFLTEESVKSILNKYFP
ncbi:Response regulator receiver domain-containing protein [Reichenbachiella faecimaris]|uniref:Response regulator receiver domain-containing protein n=1 Tax=Reichenbachiella faecimaris TaxID=692418 RepID=A0A1W2GHK2_REIFA|nr:response regulator [Reichenbachiella faecimaris]SMD36024.1 Response regulator receiver domain-containing protein [Reichenbachiella faecimaris]